MVAPFCNNSWVTLTWPSVAERWSGVFPDESMSLIVFVPPGLSKNRRQVLYLPYLLNCGSKFYWNAVYENKMCYSNEVPSIIILFFFTSRSAYCEIPPGLFGKKSNNIWQIISWIIMYITIYTGYQRLCLTKEGSIIYTFLWDGKWWYMAIPRKLSKMVRLLYFTVVFLYWKCELW